MSQVFPRLWRTAPCFASTAVTISRPVQPYRPFLKGRNGAGTVAHGSPSALRFLILAILAFGLPYLFHKSDRRIPNAPQAASDLVFRTGVVILIGVVATVLAGTYVFLAIDENSKGRSVLTKSQRIAFVPFTTQKFDLTECEAVLTDYEEAGSNAIPLGLMLLHLFSGEPGLRMFFGKHEAFAVRLRIRQRKIPVTVYRGPSEDAMRKIVNEIQYASNLRARGNEMPLLRGQSNGTRLLVI